MRRPILCRSLWMVLAVAALSFGIGGPPAYGCDEECVDESAGQSRCVLRGYYTGITCYTLFGGHCVYTQNCCPYNCFSGGPEATIKVPGDQANAEWLIMATEAGRAAMLATRQEKCGLDAPVARALAGGYYNIPARVRHQ